MHRRRVKDHVRRTQTGLRLIPELRNYHVASVDDYSPSESYYFQRKYDLSGSDTPHHEQISLWRALTMVLSRRYSHLIIWEPLWVRMLPRHILLVTAWRVRHWRRRPVLSYAMENNDIRSLMVGDGSIPDWLVSAFARVLGVYIRFAYTRIAYASEGARNLYHSIPLVNQVESALIPNLPARPASCQHASRGMRVVMVASMELRKGTEILMHSWPTVEAALPHAKLVIIGGGPEAERVAQWAASKPDSRTYLGPLDHSEVHAELARSTVLVLPSVRAGRWREQIGLPLHEGLMHGLTVVTTDETGLAAFLARAGHYVMPIAEVCERLSGALIAALRQPLDPEAVRSVLPVRAGRIVADRWLTSADA